MLSRKESPVKDQNKDTVAKDPEKIQSNTRKTNTKTKLRIELKKREL